MTIENINAKKFLARLKKNAEKLQDDISSINDFLLQTDTKCVGEEYRLLWTQLKAMELLHCCIRNRIEYYEKMCKIEKFEKVWSDGNR